MKTNRRLFPCVLTLAAIGMTVPALADSAPPISGPSPEALVARHDGFVFPDALRTLAGRRLPHGEYDLALVRTEEGLFLQVTDPETGKGTRVAPDAIGEIVGKEDHGTTSSVLLWDENGQDLLVFQSGGLAASFSLREIKRSL